MAKTTDTSVLANLKDLFEMETDRRVEQAAARERAKAAEAARLEGERRAREEAIAAARADERRRAEQERAAQDAAVEDRMRSLRAELAEVRAAREQVRLQVAAMAARPDDTSSRRGSWIAGGMAAVSLVAALTATAVAWPQSTVEVAQLDRPPASEETASEPVAEAPVVEDDAPAVEPETPEPVAVAEADPAPRVRPRHRPRPRPQTVQDDLSQQLDLGDDEGVLSDDFLRQAER